LAEFLLDLQQGRFDRFAFVYAHLRILLWVNRFGHNIPSDVRECKDVAQMIRTNSVVKAFGN
ncbi:MAG: hypothetical protein ACJ72Z_07795, partial [Pyrinomonadaceae bacterium]